MKGTKMKKVLVGGVLLLGCLTIFATPLRNLEVPPGTTDGQVLTYFGPAGQFFPKTPASGGFLVWTNSAGTMISIQTVSTLQLTNAVGQFNAIEIYDSSANYILDLGYNGMEIYDPTGPLLGSFDAFGVVHAPSAIFASGKTAFNSDGSSLFASNLKNDTNAVFTDSTGYFLLDPLNRKLYRQSGTNNVIVGNWLTLALYDTTGLDSVNWNLRLLTGDWSANGKISSSGGFASGKNNQTAPSTISVGSSPFSYTNTTGFNDQVFLDANGANTAVTYNGTAIFGALVGGDHTIILQTNEWITVTYSVATPSMKHHAF